jgi:electron transport complex protein RnfC
LLKKNNKRGRTKLNIRKGKAYPYGIHVKDMKELSNNCPIEPVKTPDRVYLSMSQHIGAPAVPVVQVGDKVKKGQLVGKENGFVSANVFTPIGGTVSEIKDLTDSQGQKSSYVIIDGDGSTDEFTFDDIADLDPKSLIERIRLAGIVGLGGAGFPTAVKLSPKNPLDTLIINGAECEPYLTCDYRLMIERTDDVYQGIKLVAKALDVKNIIIGIEANKPLAIKAFSAYPDLEVVVLKKQYPMGSEKHLIYCTTGRKVPVAKMPFDVGCCVQNIKTMIACYEAIKLNKPLTETVMTVSGAGINTPKNLKVALGTPFEDIVNHCGGIKDNAVKLVCGGPMMGRATAGLIRFVKKTDSGFLVLADDEANLQSPTNCINCAKCAKNCPMRLMPMYIEQFALAGDYKGAEKYGAMNCLECGSCAYNCPAKRPLVQNISMAKNKIREMKKNG